MSALLYVVKRADNGSTAVDVFHGNVWDRRAGTGAPPSDQYHMIKVKRAEPSPGPSAFPYGVTNLITLWRAYTYALSESTPKS